MYDAGIYWFWLFAGNKGVVEVLVDMHLVLPNRFVAGSILPLSCEYIAQDTGNHAERNGKWPRPVKAPGIGIHLQERPNVSILLLWQSGGMCILAHLQSKEISVLFRCVISTSAIRFATKVGHQWREAHFHLDEERIRDRCCTIVAYIQELPFCVIDSGREIGHIARGFILPFFCIATRIIHVFILFERLTCIEHASHALAIVAIYLCVWVNTPILVFLTCYYESIRSNAGIV